MSESEKKPKRVWTPLEIVWRELYGCEIWCSCAANERRMMQLQKATQEVLRAIRPTYV